MLWGMSLGEADRELGWGGSLGKGHPPLALLATSFLVDSQWGHSLAAAWFLSP